MLYSDGFYRFHHSDKTVNSAYRIVEVLRELVNFDSVIDIGCGVGQILRACRDSGSNIIRGVDGSWVKSELLVIPHDCFSAFDISQPGLSDKIPEKHFDLTVSSEVAEHIDADGTENYMNNLTSFSDVILFSAAIPHQRGTHHVNEQWPSYWAEKFLVRGFVPADCIRFKLWNDKNISVWYRQNLIVFVRKDALHKYPMLEREILKPLPDVVHPELWDARYREFEALIEASKVRNMGPKRIIKNIVSGLIHFIPSVIRSVRKRLSR